MLQGILQCEIQITFVRLQKKREIICVSSSLHLQVIRPHHGIFISQSRCGPSNTRAHETRKNKKLAFNIWKILSKV